MNDDNMQRLAALQTLHESPFTSGVPVLGPVIVWFRTLWNNVATRWYVRPLIHQQSLFNAAVMAQLQAQAEALQAINVRLEFCEKWLTDQDRDQTQLTHDMGELVAEVAQQRQSLHDLSVALAHEGVTPDNDRV
jgi:hypothetical protein